MLNINSAFSARPDSSGLPVSASAVRRRLIEVLGPTLAKNGFGRFSRGQAWRYNEKWVDVLEINFFRSPGVTGHSPSLNIGRYFLFVPEDAISGPVKIDNGQAKPTPDICHFRRTIFKTLRQRETKINNIWFIGPRGEYLDDCIADVRASTETQIIPWFRWLDDMPAVFELLRFGQGDIEGKDPDPVRRGTWNFTNFFSRHVVAGLVAAELYQWRLVVELLAPVMEARGVIAKNGQIFPLPEKTMNALGITYADALRRIAGEE